MENQKTIGKGFTLRGKGLHTGKPVNASFYPEKEDSGIIFVRKDLKALSPIRLRDFASLKIDTDRRSIIGKDPENYVETVEHVLAAAWGAGIDNLRIELDASEFPCLDGSAAGYLEAFNEAGSKEQKSERSSIVIKEPIWVEEKESFLGAFPSDTFKVSFILEHSYPALGRQSFSKVVDREVFINQIARARTLWFVPPGPGSVEEKAEQVKKAGYGRGATRENTLIIEESKILNDTRFPDEPVRHGVLDLIGDLYLLERPIRGRVIAIRSGHKLNVRLVKKIKECICR